MFEQGGRYSLLSANPAAHSALDHNGRESISAGYGKTWKYLESRSGNDEHFPWRCLHGKVNEVIGWDGHLAWAATGSYASKRKLETSLLSSRFGDRRSYVGETWSSGGVKVDANIDPLSMWLQQSSFFETMNGQQRVMFLQHYLKQRVSKKYLQLISQLSAASYSIVKPSLPNSKEPLQPLATSASQIMVSMMPILRKLLRSAACLPTHLDMLHHLYSG